MKETLASKNVKLAQLVKQKAQFDAETAEINREA